MSGDWAGDFRSAADKFVAAWQQKGEGEPPGPIWQASEIAIHTWDLVKATGQDHELRRRRGRAGARVHVERNDSGEPRETISPEELDAPDDAPAYDRLVAFAGRGSGLDSGSWCRITPVPGSRPAKRAHEVERVHLDVLTATALLERATGRRR